MNTKIGKDLLGYIDWILLILAVVSSLFLTNEYVRLIQNQRNSGISIIQELELAIIPNFIPVLVSFAISYLLFNRIRKYKQKLENEELCKQIETIANSTATSTGLQISNRLQVIDEEIKHVNPLVEDWFLHGIEAVCGENEINEIGHKELMTTKQLKVIGLGLTWLLHNPDNHNRMKQILFEGGNEVTVTILLPNPLEPLIERRVNKDEPETHSYELSDLARNIRAWYDLKNNSHHEFNPNALEIKVYDTYPVVNMSIYDERLYVAPYLYKRAGVDSLTVIYRRKRDGTSTVGARIYEEHFEQVYNSSQEITPGYLALLNRKFPRNHPKK